VADAPLGLVTEYLHRVAAPLSALADADLLRRYAAGRAKGAFAQLLRRHGPMVLGVCRRALGPTPDADDAFQATFVALARQAARVSECVPGWLFRVAVRTSRRALRRAERVVPPTEMRDKTDGMAVVEWREVRRLLDEELNCLPARWRSPLVLCYLDGLTRDEAAKQLGWSLRTLHRRLDEGRQRLRERLTRRGLGPAVLAAAVLGTDDLRAEMSAALMRTTAGLAARGATVPAAIRALIPPLSSTGGLAMKAVFSVLVLVGTLAVTLGERQPTAAGPAPVVVPPPVVARAPAAKDRPPDDPLAKKVQEALDRAVKWLLAHREKDGTWEAAPFATGQAGGPTALAVLALLEAGVNPNDERLEAAMGLLRKLEPKQVYVVSLQTQVFCAANQKADAERIKRNVKWLEKAAARGGDGKLLGWSYTDAPGARADNSNSRFAVAALYAAHRVGFKTTDDAFWQHVRESYVRSQLPSGGWGYVEQVSRETNTMTAAGAMCLTLAMKATGREDKAADQAVEAGLEWLATHFQIGGTYTYYGMDVVSALGRAREVKAFGQGAKARQWYREGCEWLLKAQKEDGSFQSTGATETPTVATSFALRFLASRPE